MVGPEWAERKSVRPQKYQRVEVIPYRHRPDGSAKARVLRQAGLLPFMGTCTPTTIIPP